MEPRLPNRPIQAGTSPAYSIDSPLASIITPSSLSSMNITTSVEPRLPIRPIQAGTSPISTDSTLSSIIIPSSVPSGNTRPHIVQELGRLGYRRADIETAIRATFRAGAVINTRNCIRWIQGPSAAIAGIRNRGLSPIDEVSPLPTTSAAQAIESELIGSGFREDQVLGALRATAQTGQRSRLELCYTWINEHTSTADGSLQVSGSNSRSSTPQYDAGAVETAAGDASDYMSIDEVDESSPGESEDLVHEPIDDDEIMDLRDSRLSSEEPDVEQGAAALSDDDESVIYDDISDQGSEVSVQESRLITKHRIERLYSRRGCNCVEEDRLLHERRLPMRFRDFGRLSGPAKMDEIRRYFRDLGVPDACGTTDTDTYGRSGNNTRLADPPLDWQLVLSGGDEPAVLDMWASETSNPSRLAAIQRWFDIDAFIGLPTTLSVHREGFYVSFYSRFSKQITQDQYLRFNGVKPYQCKHLRLGYSDASPGWDTFVLFPAMPRGPTRVNHLTDEEQRVWVDDILLSACKTHLSERSQERLPRDFEADRLKARARQAETTSTQAINQMEAFYYIPHEKLGDVWAAVKSTLARSNNPQHAIYQGAFLLVLHYGCKERFAAETMELAREKFVNHFNRAFDSRYMPLDSCWVDLAWEDVPSSTDGRNGTNLLQKSHCLKTAFEEAGLQKPQQYTWQMTQDAGSARRAAGWKHANRRGGFVFMQGYNVEKEDFATLAKKHTLFGETGLDDLAVRESTLKRWAEANQAGSGSSVSRQRLLKAFTESKKRAYTPMLGDRAGKNWGRRTEVRISGALLLMLDEPTALQTDTSLAVPGGGRHRPFWVLLDRQVSSFKVMNYNRYVAAINTLIDRVSEVSNKDEASILEEQAHNSAMLKVLLETLRYTANNGFPKEQSALWHRRYGPRHMEDSNVDGRAVRARGPVRAVKQGLGFSESLANFNFAWLPEEMFNWRTLTFKDEVLRQTTFLHRNFGRFRHWKRQRLADREDRFLADISVKLRQAVEDRDAGRTESDIPVANYLEVLYQFIAQNLAKYIINMLMYPRRGQRPEPEIDPAHEGITRDERQGYMGLYPSFVKRALGDPDMLARIAFPQGNLPHQAVRKSDKCNRLPKHMGMEAATPARREPTL